MKEYFKPLLHLTQTRKFWVGVATAVVAYFTIKFGYTPEIVLVEGLLGALGVFAVDNKV